VGGFVHRRNRIALVLHPAEAEILAGLLGQLLDLVVPAEPLDDDPLSALIGIGSTTEPVKLTRGSLFIVLMISTWPCLLGYTAENLASDLVLIRSVVTLPSAMVMELNVPPL